MTETDTITTEKIEDDVDAALVAAFVAHGATTGAEDFASRCADVAAGESPSWVTGRDSDDDSDLTDALAGMGEDERRRAAVGAQDAYLSAVGRPKIPSVPLATDLWDYEVGSVSLGERWSNAFVAAWTEAANAAAA